jgi:ATP-binding cassette subfamily F protein 3
LLALVHPTRFHTETLDTASKEIDMKGVNISIGKADLVVDSHLRLKAGVRYSFLGRYTLFLLSKATHENLVRNGTGKSTLFFALRDDLIPGFPPSVRVLLVSQTESDTASVSGGTVDDVALDELSVLDKVISSDRVRAKAMGDLEGVHIPCVNHSPLDSN